MTDQEPRNAEILLDILIFLEEQLNEMNQEVEEWLYYSESLLHKYYLHAQSLLNITKGYNLTGSLNKPNFYYTTIFDRSSTNTLLRALFENFLIYQHIYINPASNEEKELRLYCLLLKTLIDRSNFNVKSSIAIEIQKNDTNEIERIKELIKENVSFKELTLKQQEQIILGKTSKFFKRWDQIMEDCRLNETPIFKQLYYLLSSHAHSEGLSLLQVKDSNIQLEANDDFINLSCFIMNILTAKLIMDITKTFPILEQELHKLSQANINLVKNYQLLFEKCIES